MIWITIHNTRSAATTHQIKGRNFVRCRTLSEEEFAAVAAWFDGFGLVDVTDGTFNFDAAALGTVSIDCVNSEGSVTVGSVSEVS